MTHFIGISGKPGAVKGRYRFKILQELRYHGYSVVVCSLAETLYSEINALITELHTLDQTNAPAAFYEALRGKYRVTPQLRDELFELLKEDRLGDKHPDYGYSRRNPNMRQALSLYGQNARHEQGEDYWIEAMVDQVASSAPDVDFAIFQDLRFPNEADWLLENDGLALRVDVDVEQIIAQYSETGGYKYSREGMNASTETALDDYDKFYIRFNQDEYFDRVSFGKEVLDYFDLSTRETPEPT